MHAPRLYITMAVATLCLGTSLVWAQGGQDDGIGLFTAVLGDVTVTHSGSTRIHPVKLHDEVLFKDVIETQDESRTKAFFNDDSILTVGENSRVEVAEYVYDPDRTIRRTVVKLVQGRLRALVSKVFTGSGSKFEIHTPTAVAAARGTYFIVWMEGETSGIVNIGESGRVDFTSRGQTVIVDPGHFSVALPGQPPVQPQLYQGHSNRDMRPDAKGKVGDLIAEDKRLPKREDRITNKGTGRETHGVGTAMKAIETTVLRDQPKGESPRDAIRAVQLEVLPTPVGVSFRSTSGHSGSNGTNSGTSLGESKQGGPGDIDGNGLGVSGPSGGNSGHGHDGTRSGSGGPFDNNSDGGPGPSGMVVVPTAVIVPVTPPAVITGVVSNSGPGSLNSGTGSK